MSRNNVHLFKIKNVWLFSSLAVQEITYKYHIKSYHTFISMDDFVQESTVTTVPRQLYLTLVGIFECVAH